MIQKAKNLRDSQIKNFDTQQISPEFWQILVGWLKNYDCYNKEWNFLDIGGGNGVFCDTLLQEFPNARCTLVDNSDYLLNRNTPNPRKKLISQSAINIESCLSDKYDVIFLNWFLHHFVSATYTKSKIMQIKILSMLHSFLSIGGRVIIAENLPYGMINDNICTRLIYSATSSQLLAPITQRLGANTAGVGICYQSERQWFETIEACGFTVEDFCAAGEWNYRNFVALILMIKSMRQGYFFLKSKK